MNADVADDDGVVGHRKLDLARRSLRRDRTRFVTEARRHQGVPLLAMAVDGRQPLAARRRVGRLATRGRGLEELPEEGDRKSTRLNSSHSCASRMQSSASKKNTNTTS